MPPRPPPILLFGRIIPPPCPSPCSVADLPLPSLAHSTSDDEDPVNNLCLGDASISLVEKAQMDPSFPSHHAHSPPRKPDQLVPCPRCHNFDTKFCYFNNYNVKQPRHFCRSCQRYWTAGGTLRNVPVGAGRRKNKTPVNPTKSHPEIATPRSAFQVPQITKENSNRGLEAPFIDVMNSNATGSSTTSYGQPPQILSSGLENFTGMGAQDAAAKKPELQPVKQESRCSSSETELQASEVVSRWQTEGGKSLHEAEGVATRNWGVPWPYLGMMGWPGMPSPQNHTTGNGAETWAWPEGFFPWPAIVAPVWTPYGFTLPWNFAWNNGAPARGNMSTTPLQGEEDDDDEKEGSLCCPKARRIHQETVTCAHAFQLLRAHNNKLHLQSQHHHHSNPAAQARSAAFREGS